MEVSRFQIDNIGVSVTNLDHTLKTIGNAVNNGSAGYICVTNSRTVYIANHDHDYCEIQNNSFLTVPDGSPLVWIAHRHGFKQVGRVTGKDLMDAIFEISLDRGYSHYFYGSTPSIISRMVSNVATHYPGVNIVGAVSPPFQPFEEFDVQAIAKEINKLKPTFFWCGLGAPKQEMLNAALQPKLDSTICIGVGLAFEYIAGAVKRAPSWMQALGLEGVYRLMQQPGRLSTLTFRLYSYSIYILFKSFLEGSKNA